MANDAPTPQAHARPAEPREDAVVEVRGLRKSYGAKRAVDGVDLTIRRGQIYAILGPNGAGKTTTVEMIAGLRSPDAGTVRVLGSDPERSRHQVQEHLGVQLQEARLPDKLRVREALDLYASFYPDPADPAELLSLLRLEDKAESPFGKLSGGQQQRLSIALSLIGRPQVAILDELTTGLDPQARRDTWALIESVRDSGVTIILVTHFMDEAERLADRIAIIDRGRVVAEGTASELISAGQERRSLLLRLPSEAPAGLREMLADLPEVDEVSEVGAALRISGAERVLPAVVAALDQRGVIPDELRTASRNLEDVFVELAGAHHETQEA
ncbi:ABC transporter ATP-binding protein [Bogoriella caseilytica]|uniref:ABC-2 type transport system ATP-binding protein n=1 Tax=Bogoriella caseilytica TaxID=56055 RepID=A0A3N2BFZ1_9MICO|nr:ABC transporter ATP-binding protein [Bogoriella caseilytica]ROR73984.1 ABC-2 type transport system ATP-binding protein [Bogoriella caseilytica]